MQLFGLKFLFVLSVLFLFPILFTSGIVGNFGDIYQYAAPFRYFAKTSLQEGLLPLWNPYLFAGTPFLASPQSALFYPLSTLFYFLPLNYAFNITTFLHIFLNALGMFLLLSFLKYSRSTTLLGSCIWSFSFFSLSKLAAGHIIHLTGYGWFPWILLFTLRLQKPNTAFIGETHCGLPAERGLPTARAGAVTRPYLLLLVLSSALQFFSGHLHVWILTMVMVSFIFFWRTLSQNRPEQISSIKVFSFYLICFLALTAIQLLPSFVYLLHSARANMVEPFSKQAAYIFATSYSMDWKNLITLIFPNYFGNPMDKTYVDPLHPSVYFETKAIYFGLLPLFFCLGGILLSLKKKKFFLPCLILFFTMLAMGKNSFLYNWIWESLAFLRVPARFFFLSLFGMLCCTLLFWEESIKKMKTTLKLAFLLVILLDLWGNGKKFVWSENPMEKIGRTQAMQWLQENLPSPSNGSAPRIFTTAEIGNPNKTMFFRIQNVNGYEAILQARLLSYFAATQGRDAVLTTGVDLKNPENPDFKFFSVKYILSTHLFKGPEPVIAMGNQLKIFEGSQSFPLVFSEPLVQPILLTKNLPNKISLSLPEREKPISKLLLSEAYYPGWSAWTSDGEKFKPLLWNGYFQMLDLTEFEKPPRVSHTLGVSHTLRKIYFLFSPSDFWIGCWLTLSSLVLIILFLWFRLNTDLRKFDKMTVSTLSS